MSRPLVRVVGLGPADLDLVTTRTQALLTGAPLARLRTRVHPAAAHFASIESYDEWYENAESFEELYAAIARDLVRLALSSPNHEVVYAVPGSPVVAERSVELLRAYDEVRVVCEPSVSVIDVACAALGRDPMSVELRVVDALASSEPLRGPGPLLVLQTYSREVLAHVAARVAPTTLVTVLFHLGLHDESITIVTASELVHVGDVDHLTSLWIDELRTVGVAAEDLVVFMRRLRHECPWDQEQTHASLTRHLLEEAYEALDALEHFARLDDADQVDGASVAHAREELGDLLFQIVFHAELFDEEGRFDLASIADEVREKLTGRHPHVFAGTVVDDAQDVARRWELIKRDEKGRESVTDGIAWQLPALSLYTKLLRKGTLVTDDEIDPTRERDMALSSLRAIDVDEVRSDVEPSSGLDARWGDVLEHLARAAASSGVDLEHVLRERAHRLADQIRSAEAPLASTGGE